MYPAEEKPVRIFLIVALTVTILGGYAISRIVSELQAAAQPTSSARNKPETPFFCDRTALTPEQRLDRSLTALNCYACHQRGSKGGPDAQVTGYSTYAARIRSRLWPRSFTTSRSEPEQRCGAISRQQW